MQYYDITISANAVFRIAAHGTFFRYYNGSAGGADESIVLTNDRQATSVLLKPGQSLILDSPAKEWTLRNFANAATITGRVVIGNARLEDDRVTGDVNVLDGGMSRSAANVSFLGSATPTPGVGNFSHVQLWNPGASGKRLIVNELSIFSMGAAASVGLYSYGTALSTLVYAGPSKLIGGAPSSAEIRMQNNASILGSPLIAFAASAMASFSEKFYDPIVIPPGQGLVVVPSQTTNLAVNAGFQWYEVAL